MGYKQIDGVKSILVKQTGELREGLRNLPPDSDRIEYVYDKAGNKKNEWPIVIVDISGEGTEDKRLLPEIVMKHHGELPKNVKCSREDFKSKSGSKSNILDSNIENLEYVGDASTEKKKPYKDAPGKEATAKDEAPEPEPEEPETKSAKKAGDEPKGKPKIDNEPSDLMKGSGALNAKEAIKIINNYEFEELVDVGFFTEPERDGDPRVTVVDAWNAKKNQAKEAQS